MKKNKRTIPAVFAGLILGATAIVCLAAAILLPAMTKKSIAAKEAALPESAISTYFQAIRQNDFDEVYQTSLLVSPHYNTLDDTSAKLSEIYRDVDLDRIRLVALDAAKEESGLIYDVVSDGQLIATLRLMQIDGAWRAGTIFQGGQEYRVEVPTGIDFTVNGLRVDPQDCVLKNTAAGNFSGLSDPDDAPKVDVYVFSNLISEPEISVEKSGYGVIRDVLSNTYYIGEKSSDSELSETFVKAAKALAQYPTKDGSLSAITSMTVSGSDFYNRIRTMDNQWYAAHNSAVFENMTVSDVIQQSETTMIGNVTFDYTISAASASKEYHCGYQLTFMKINGSWKIAGLGIDNTMK